MVNNLYPQVAQNVEEDTESKQTSRIFYDRGYNKQKANFWSWGVQEKLLRGRHFCQELNEE